jgi:sugar porter (SP) family MFS transporter
MSPGEPSRKTIYQRRLQTVVMVATFGGILFGYDTGVVNGALEPMKAELGLNTITEGMVTSFLQLGAAVGATAIGVLTDRLGRRRSLLYLSWVFVFGTLGCVLAPNLYVLLGSRVILGLAVGGASVTVPIYLSEMAPTELRGRFSGRNDVAVCFGQLASFVCNALIARAFGGHEGVWRYMLAVAIIPALMLFAGMLRMPESPRWLLERGLRDQALAVLRQVRSTDRAASECESITQLTNDRAAAKAGLREIWRTGWIKKLIGIGIGIALVQQLTGINAVMFYGTELLKTAGFAADTAIVVNIGNGVVSVAGMLIGLHLISRYPRRRLILSGLACIAILHCAIALLAAILAEGLAKALVIMALILVFVLIMQACLGLVVWVVLGEMFPLRVRGAAMGLATFWMWIGNASVGFSFPSLMEAFGIKGTFLVFGIINVASCFFVNRYLPETGDRSLEQLEEDFAAGKNLVSGR